MLEFDKLPRTADGVITGLYAVRVSNVDIGPRGPYTGQQVTRYVHSFGPGAVSIESWDAPAPPPPAPAVAIIDAAAIPLIETAKQAPPKPTAVTETAPPKKAAEPKRKPKAEPLDW